MRFEVLNRYTRGVQFIAEIDCDEAAPESTKRGLAVKWAVEHGADLSRADLARADLAGADLSRANLSGVFLSGADLARANLARANLTGAYLSNAYLTGANLSGAYLARANLARAYLTGANLAGANLAGADLTDADLTGVYLADAKWSNGAQITRAPLMLNGLIWPVIILDAHMQIGCQLHRLSEWAAFDDRAIKEMHADALEFWTAHGATLLSMARADGRDFSAKPNEEEAVK